MVKVKRVGAGIVQELHCFILVAVGQATAQTIKSKGYSYSLRLKKLSSGGYAVY